ncbi:hypothetical protein D1007_29855 [Hordeum vulgare]|nr:hypothetical protein D1007_29855 [Hordeum vulgare]
MNPGGSATAARPTANKKARKKLRSELTSAELAKLDAELAKKRNRRTNDKEKKAAVDITTEVAALCSMQHQADVDDKEAIIAKAHTLLMLGLCRPSSVILSIAAMAATSTGSSAARPLQHRDMTSLAF